MIKKTLAGICLMMVIFLVQGCQPEKNTGTIISDSMVYEPVPGHEVTVGYASLYNSGSQDVKLVGISAPENTVAKTEIHGHRMTDDGNMMMFKVDSLVLPSHEKVILKPGEYHIMLMGLKNTLVKGDSFLLTFYFSDGSSQRVSVPVISRTTSGEALTH
ncbi:hypothetical protein CI610_00158 [invertebrate metagenome]|uniref:Copper chaperone PCu(A)C n=1 Tax=invertebrate metagenome TaxID=1711999 RepID=A0A2H9TC44_9ZZZZ